MGYPHLFRPTDWGFAKGQFEQLTEPPELRTIDNIVPFVGENVIIVQVEGGYVEMPGGTLCNPEEADTELRGMI